MAKAPTKKQAKSESPAGTIKLIANHSVIVVRDKQQVEVPPGKPFDYFGDEVKDILKAQPGSLRKPVDETSDEGQPAELLTDEQLLKEAIALDESLIAEAEESETL